MTEDNDDETSSKATTAASIASPAAATTSNVGLSSKTPSRVGKYQLLVMIPRGLEQDVMDQIRRQQLHPIPTTQSSTSNNDNAVVEMSILEEAEHFQHYGERARQLLVERQEQQQHRTIRPPYDCTIKPKKQKKKPRRS